MQDDPGQTMNATPQGNSDVPVTQARFRILVDHIVKLDWLIRGDHSTQGKPSYNRVL